MICALCHEPADKLHYVAPGGGLCRECFILERDHPVRFVAYPPVVAPNTPAPGLPRWNPPMYVLK